MNRGLLRTAACVLALRRARPDREASSRCARPRRSRARSRWARSTSTSSRRGAGRWTSTSRSSTGASAPSRTRRRSPSSSSSARSTATPRLTALRSGGSANASLAGLEAELRDAVADGLRRAAALRPPRRAVGGLLGGAVIAVFTRRRWLLLGPAAGLAVTFAAVVLVGAGRQPVRLRRAARADLLRPRRGAAAAARVLGARAGGRRGLRRLLRRRGRGPHAADRGRRGARRSTPAQIDRAIVVASDLHSNSLVLPGARGLHGREAGLPRRRPDPARHAATRRGSSPGSRGSARRSSPSPGTTTRGR